ncbi:hypothetical protein [uncultured Ferrimonas sp.]|uniref:hypothetical protein n=1 Tax=uncultured Ferrimonas sp. TaxID=432640 RepID=UPI002606A742|nr:hypothetical protein [uncultured Ferrimonas sp.]
MVNHLKLNCQLYDTRHELPLGIGTTGRCQQICGEQIAVYLTIFSLTNAKANV